MYEAEASALRKLASREDVLIFYSAHALDELAKDGITRQEIRAMLRRCSVTRADEGKKLRAEGTDGRWRRIAAVVIPSTDIFVVTGWWEKPR